MGILTNMPNDILIWQRRSIRLHVLTVIIRCVNSQLSAARNQTINKVHVSFNVPSLPKPTIPTRLLTLFNGSGSIINMLSYF